MTLSFGNSPGTNENFCLSSSGQGTHANKKELIAAITTERLFMSRSAFIVFFIVSINVPFIRGAAAQSACPPIPSIDELIDILGLIPRPEGGWLRETFRSNAQVDSPHGTNRSAMSSQYYVIQDQLNFHIAKFDECWNYYSGSNSVAMYELLAEDGGTVR
eukprot:CAMPEP_0172507954 /NCGR_PEP_ID=MMETSP1066-20121228/208058_1 /TAXON_ID=671091 /ORGANISM="Coscinodiscus wailesii, Strain CCMP2513" /LENGTH=159 /DNA_ID=CAMNT_0013285719 /DNA_START=66 /DNA_END=541 /DNA_ORIENTATION=-